MSKTTITPKKVDSGWKTWKARVLYRIDSVNGFTKVTIKEYKCGVRIFKNFKSPPALTGIHDFHMSISINQYGLYDGTITYRDFYRTCVNGGGGTVL